MTTAQSNKAIDKSQHTFVGPYNKQQRNKVRIIYGKFEKYKIILVSV